MAWICRSGTSSLCRHTQDENNQCRQHGARLRAYAHSRQFCSRNCRCETIKRKAINNLSFLMECTPGNYNNEGQPDAGTGLTGEQYGGGPIEFYDLVRKWRGDRPMKGVRAHSTFQVITTQPARASAVTQGFVI